jgi:hypothetical protein
MNRCCVVMLLILTSLGLAQTRLPSSCTIEDSKRAFDAVDKLDDWEAVRRFYGTYLPCDDGGVAEGVSDAITRLLGDKWTDFWRLRSTIKDGKQFQGFILKHIDATASDEALQAVSRNARQRCPKGDPALCKKIADAASCALKESGQ